MPRRTLLQTSAALPLRAPALLGFAQRRFTLKFYPCMAQLFHGWLSVGKPRMGRVTKKSGGRIQGVALTAANGWIPPAP